MYGTICYHGFSARDFTELSAARKKLAPSAELRFFTSAAELLDHVNHSHAIRTLVLLDTRVLDLEEELLRRLQPGEADSNVRVVLLSSAVDAAEFQRAQASGAAACLQSPVSTGNPPALLSPDY